MFRRRLKIATEEHADGVAPSAWQRAYCSKDAAECGWIDLMSHVWPWTPEDIERSARSSGCMGRVAVCPYAGVIGYAIYHLSDRKVTLRRLAVHPDHRRMGVGSGLVLGIVASHLTPVRRRLVMDVVEDNLAAHLFLRACHFKAVTVFRRMFPHPSLGRRDMYRFVFLLDSTRKDSTHAGSHTSQG